ncbi:MAG: GatB/YqeY domain-containing protein [Gammaproteobacteria bacterium]|nr:GatB/YqeY domain-containing protein [Gammaproteobacteria bacterium]
MTDTLKPTIQSEMKDAMKSGNKTRLATIRLIMAAIKQREVDERIELDDDQVIAVLDKMVKQRRESIKMYQDAERLDLAEVEQNEIAVIQDFLPESLSEAEIDQMIKSVVAETGAESMRDMGKVMGKLKPLMQGRADMAQVSSRIKSLLS